MSKQLQWYPGHMHKTIRELKEISRKIDIFFLLLDARAPNSSMMETLREIIGDKKVVVLLTKADLVEKKELNKWREKYKREYGSCYAISLGNKKQVRKEILNILSLQNFKKLLPKFSIIGIPNVGKSTLLNILINKKSAIIEDRAGVTKTITWYQFENKYWILDTPGILEPKFDDNEKGVALAAIGSIKIDILPMHEVAEGIFKILEEKGIKTQYSGDYVTKLNNALNESNLNPKDFYRSIIMDFQKNKYGKIILDKWE